MKSVGERFWSKVSRSKVTECWPWTAGVDSSGYGKFFVKTSSGRERSLIASRVAYMLTHGPIPPGTLVRHTCDNAKCCNPAHLVLGSHTENMGDVVARARQRGVRNNNAKCTPGVVAAIRLDHAKGVSQRTIASTYGVSLAVVSKIVLHQNWS